MIAKRISGGKIVLLFGDVIIIFAAINLASQIRIKSLFSFINIGKFLISLLIIIIYVLSFYIFDFYNTKIKFTTTKFLMQFIGGLALASLLITISFLIFPYFFGRGISLISLILIAFFTFIWRILFSFLFRVTVSARNVLIIREGKEAQFMRFLLKDNPQYKLLGFIADESRVEAHKTDILGNIHSIEKVVNNYGINDIVLAIDP
ncbi:MAG: nucleoside-diphosphate sugar epimerase/dehydratase, partial [Promethearchaeota archaeon]